MTPIVQYWLPILVATLLCFVSGAVLHTALPLHRKDWRPLPDEDALLAVLKRIGVTPGNYMFPAPDMSKMKDPVYLQRLADNPGGVMTVRPPGGIAMGPYLGKQFVYHLIISIFIAYVACWLFPAGTGSKPVFHFTFMVAGLSYVGALFPEAIWYHQPRNYVIGKVVDGVVWALLTAGAFALLGPKA